MVASQAAATTTGSSSGRSRSTMSILTMAGTVAAAARSSDGSKAQIAIAIGETCRLDGFGERRAGPRAFRLDHGRERDSIAQAGARPAS